MEFKFDPRKICFEKDYMSEEFGAGGAYLSRPSDENYAMTAKPVGPMKMQQRLDLAVKNAELALADAKRARELFEKHPFIEELMDLMNRGRI